MDYEKMLDHQDWKTIVITNPKKGKDKKKTSKLVNHKIISIEKKADNDQLHHKKVDQQLRLKIIKNRNALNLTQKQLATKINIPVSSINDIESGKSIYNHQHIQKIMKVLKIK